MADKKPLKKARSKVPQKQGWRVFFSVLLMLIWTGVSVILAQLLVGVVAIKFMGVDDFNKPAVQAVYTALAYIVAILLAIWVPAYVEAKWDLKKSLKIPSRKLLGLRGLPTWTDVGLAPIGFVVALILAGVLVSIFGLFPWFNAEEAQNLGFSFYVAGIDKIVAFISLVVIAPIAEEIIFRGWLYGKIRNKTSEAVSNKVSMILSSLLVSLLFGIVHLQWNVGVNVFAMSLVMCAMREVTGTIYAGILMHMIKNGVAFYLLYVLGIM